MIVPILLVVSLFIAVEPDSFNQVFDGIIIVYLIGVLTAITLFYRRAGASILEAEEAEKRSYTWKKKSKILTWQQKFTGTWTKVERTNFYEFMLFNGAPSFVASIQKDSAFGQIIEFKPEDESFIKISMTGFPASTGVWIKYGTSEENALQNEVKDPNGRKVLVKMWWNEEEQTFYSKGYNTVDKVWSTQTRKFNEDGQLLLTIENVRDSDGGTCAFHSRFKKTASH